MRRLTARQLFRIFLKLGLTSFGGPVAHLSYFREEFVVRNRILEEKTYANLVALCQFLPGPASSQVGIGIGISQAGLRGGLAAWCGFTLPSAIALILLAYGITTLEESVISTGGLHGLKIAAVAIVAQAVWGMGKKLCPDLPRKTVALFAALLAISWSGVLGQLSAILGSAILGLFYFHTEQHPEPAAQLFVPSKRTAISSLSLFFILLFTLPLLARSGSQTLAVADSFFRSGSLVFGGGHVVLPLLQAEVVNSGWISKDLFLTGYGATQAVPGPLFTFSAYLGTALEGFPNGWLGGLLCLLMIFLPSLLMLLGILPFWNQLQKNVQLNAALQAVNAAVVGLLLAAFIDPVCSNGILSVGDFLLALAALGLLTLGKVSPWLVVGITGISGAFIANIPGL